ncbi:MAG: metallophosphoesterase [Gemmatimonadetes bacterium]|nr:metallophosphoesterase [Gemmatimonadota bacterium]
MTTLVHVSDIHFGGLADIRQVEALEAQLPALEPAAVVVSGDHSQRARAGELQRARAFLHFAETVAPVHVVPGNHDVQWWREPLGIPILGAARYRKYRRYISDHLAPILTVDGAIICGTVSAHGLAAGSITWNLRDLTVKGHLPASELARAGRVFADGPQGLARVLVVHHNVLKGRLSRRWGLARPQAALAGIVRTGADVVCCGHDHEEGIGTIERDGRRVVVSTAGTLCTRTRGKRPSSFNVLRVTPTGIRVEIHRFDASKGRFACAEGQDFPR